MKPNFRKYQIKKVSLLLLLGVFTFVIGCKTKSTQNLNTLSSKQKGLLCLTRWFNETENDFSFPVFFEQEIIRKHRIKRIERKKYEYTDGDSSLVESYTYYFSPSGFIHEIDINYFYEEFLIDHYTLRYPSKCNYEGYALPVVMHHGKDSLKAESAKYPFDIHLYKRENTFASTYLDFQTKGNYYFLKDKNAGIYKVGREIHPHKKDLIFYGNIRKSKKWHRLQNKVIENDVALFTYEKNHLVKNVFKKSNFLARRHYRYNRYSLDNIVDSVFVKNVFLHTEQISFVYQKDHLPVEWVWKRGNKISVIETLNYEF